MSAFDGGCLVSEDIRIRFGVNGYGVDGRRLWIIQCTNHMIGRRAQTSILLMAGVNIWLHMNDEHDI